MSIFPTNLGWFGFLGHEVGLLSVLIGHATADEVRQQAIQRLVDAKVDPEFIEHDWKPELRHRLERYSLGQRVEFEDVSLVLPEGTEFQQRVLKATRRIGYGKTISYGRLADKAGYPRAARAVGSVMAQNRFPIILPCHRVVAAGDQPGGYSAPQGVSLKVRLLALESANERPLTLPRKNAKIASSR